MLDNHVIGSVLKALPSAFKAAGEDELWALATVEVMDREGDIVRVKGISLEYHKPEMPIKVLGLGHKYSPGADGELPITGLVKEFVPTTTTIKGHGEVPALAFRMEFDRDEKGELTGYSRRMKSLYKGDAAKGLKPKLDSFSIGFDPQAEPIRLRGGRYDFTKTAIFEISPCVIPANPHATVLKALREQFGEDLDALSVLEERMLQLNQQNLETILKALQTRFDDFESANAERTLAGSRSPSRRASRLSAFAKALREQP
jgi:hypothetical protein